MNSPAFKWAYLRTHKTQSDNASLEYIVSSFQISNFNNRSSSYRIEASILSLWMSWARIKTSRKVVENSLQRLSLRRAVAVKDLWAQATRRPAERHGVPRHSQARQPHSYVARSWGVKFAICIIDKVRTQGGGAGAGARAGAGAGAGEGRCLKLSKWLVGKRCR